MSVTDFTNLINVDVDVFVVSTPNEFEMDFKKSRLSSSLNSTWSENGVDLRDGSETGVGNNNFFSVK